ncbi:MAG: ubiquinol-cytochrome c reductase iron-sulfur subunit [Chloroflexota bacterium]
MAENESREGLFYPGSEAADEARQRGASSVPPFEQAPRRRGFWSRRAVLRGTGWGVFLAMVGQWLGGFGSFFWPKKVGAFGGEVLAGTVDSMKVGDVKLVQEGKFYLARVPEGFLALWWKCPHLGCTVPWKPEGPTFDEFAAKGQFNCPCHGSLYDRYGQIVQGPAPRPMDTFPLSIRDGKIYVNTNPTLAKVRVRADHSSDPTPA